MPCPGPRRLIAALRIPGAQRRVSCSPVKRIVPCRGRIQRERELQQRIGWTTHRVPERLVRPAVREGRLAGALRSEAREVIGLIGRGVRLFRREEVLGISDVPQRRGEQGRLSLRELAGHAHGATVGDSAAQCKGNARRADGYARPPGSFDPARTWNVPGLMGCGWDHTTGELLIRHAGARNARKGGGPGARRRVDTPSIPGINEKRLPAAPLPTSSRPPLAAGQLGCR